MRKYIGSRTLEEEFEEYIKEELGVSYYEDFENWGSARWEYAFESSTEIDSIFRVIDPEH